MDKLEHISDYLAGYAEALTFADLPTEVIYQTKRLWIDTIACAIGGFSSEPAKIARDLAKGISSQKPATVLGTEIKTTPDLAAFANGISIRYMDYNDTYTGNELGHPSDHLATIIAAGEFMKSTGKEAIVATVLAYEIFCRFCDATIIRNRGFDYATLGTISSVITAGKLLNLTREEFVQALNLSIAANIALFQTRVGDVSMWKGCAFANVSRNAMFASILASMKLTGPSPIFEGRGGFFKAISGNEFQLYPFGGKDIPFKIMESSMKRFPLGHLSQTVVEAAIQVRPNIAKIEDIVSVEIQTLQTAIDIMAGDSEKWHPPNRETADHSMPYVTSIALIHGSVEEHHFEDDHLNNPDLLNLIGKVTVVPSEKANLRWPEAMLSTVIVKTKLGQSYSAEVPYHRGHWKNPMDNSELEEKFHSLTSKHMSGSKRNTLLKQLWDLEEVSDVGQLVQMLNLDEGNNV